MGKNFVNSSKEQVIEGAIFLTVELSAKVEDITYGSSNAAARMTEDSDRRTALESLLVE